MPAIDHCEPAIVRALQRAGWVVTDQPLTIRADTGRLGYIYADLRLQQNVTDGDAIVVVEVKCFESADRFLDDFYRAVGQYIVYRNAIRLQGETIPVYLALPWIPFQRYFGSKLIQAALDDVRIDLIVVNLDTEEIVQWITSDA